MFEDGGCLRLAATEADVAQRHVPGEARDRPQCRAVVALLGFLLQHVVDPIEQHVAALEVVPEHQQIANGRVSQGHERVECHQAANRQAAIQDLVCPRPEEKADGKKGHRTMAPRRSSP